MFGPTDLIHPSPAPHSKTSPRAYSNAFLLPQLYIYVTKFMGRKGCTARSLLPKNKKGEKKQFCLLIATKNKNMGFEETCYRYRSYKMNLSNTFHEPVTQFTSSLIALL
jgi:hypothetical protein